MRPWTKVLLLTNTRTLENTFHLLCFIMLWNYINNNRGIFLHQCLKKKHNQTARLSNPCQHRWCFEKNSRAKRKLTHLDHLRYSAKPVKRLQKVKRWLSSTILQGEDWANLCKCMCKCIWKCKCMCKCICKCILKCICKCIIWKCKCIVWKCIIM